MRFAAAASIQLGLTMAACTNGYDDITLLGPASGGGAATTSSGQSNGGGASGGAGGGGTGAAGGGGPSGSGGSTSATSSVSSSASSGGGGAGGSPPLECWGPDAVCCGGVACPVATMECCATSQGQVENANCVAKGTCATLTIACDDWADCPGEVCCTDWNNSINQHLAIECLPECMPPNQLGESGIYPICSLAGGSCPYGLDCFEDYYIGDAGWGYCY
jgi:hypothetical protein